MFSYYIEQLLSINYNNCITLVIIMLMIINDNNGLNSMIYKNPMICPNNLYLTLFIHI